MLFLYRNIWFLYNYPCIMLDSMAGSYRHIF